MTEAQRAHFRRLLERRRDELNRRIAAAQADADSAEEGIREGEGGDPAVQGAIADTALGVGTVRSDEWREVEMALDRLARGEYGRCEVCGGDIELERLEAMPSARTCAADARRTDRRHVPRL